MKKKKYRVKVEEIIGMTEKLINSEEYLSRSRKRANDFTRKRKMPFVKLGYDDIYQAGCEALCHAAITYDGSVQFDTYATTQRQEVYATIII